MKVATKFVAALSTAQQHQLEALAAHAPARRVRMRAHSLLLSANGTSIDEIARIYRVHRTSVSAWIDQWHAQGLAGLADKPRPGGPTKLDAAEQALARQLLKQHPHAPKTVLARLHEQTGKSISPSTLTRLAKGANLRWKRARKSLKAHRDEAAFTQAKKELDRLKKQQAGHLNLVYFDEVGFSLDPSIPYAWQPIGETIELPVTKGKRLNVLGFFTADNDLTPFCVETTMTTDIVVGCFEAFSQTITKKTVVIIDKAPIHTSQALLNKVPTWKKKGLIRKFIPAYCPELNLIEILWRFIKYRWLPFSAYLNFDALVAAVEEILVQVGSKYTIEFQ